MKNHEKIQPATVQKEPVDFFALIKRDYGITRVGETEFQATIHGVLFEGSLSSVINAVKGEQLGPFGNP